MSKCLYGKTQNSSGSLKRCYVGRTTLSMGASSAVIDFNDSVHGILKDMKEYGLEEGNLCTHFSIFQDSNRIMEMGRKSNDNAEKKSRKRPRAMRKGFSDKVKEKEGLTYLHGICEVFPNL